MVAWESGVGSRESGVGSQEVALSHHFLILSAAKDLLRVSMRTLLAFDS
jgi:hypothetical protein